jgi:hypothetical protein
MLILIIGKRSEDQITPGLLPKKERQMSDDDRFTFSEIFNNGVVKIYKNDCGEIFIEDLKSGVKIRLNRYPHHNGGLIFTTSDLVEPTTVTNMIAWKITPRKCA